MKEELEEIGGQAIQTPSLMKAGKDGTVIWPSPKKYRTIAHG